ncbi:MAG TPA: NAD(P)-dependent oxidoreductase [Planctomycetota bacterium]|nr:NAD(P)-dependent oxidoreductase [Planctomycetota bacterium]
MPAERLERRMADYHPALTEAQAIAEANRCLYCHDAPCIAACPTAIDIPEFIRKIATKNYRSSAKTILDANILGLSCARVCPVEVLCAGACVYNHLDRPPIEIGRLQRFSTEWAYDRKLRLHKAGTPNGRKVACVGAGPASLACAAELAQLGYAVTIYEGRELPGGLNTTGVAPYKLFAEDALREVEAVLAIGNIDLQLGRWVARDTFKELEKQFDAIFVGVGLGRDSRLRVPGEDAEGIFGAVELIELLKNKPAAELSWLSSVKSAIVVGGGNTSIDVVRELRKLGVPRVRLVYRRGEGEIPAYAHEVKAARAEGVELCFHAQSVEVLGDERVKGLKVIRTRPGQKGQGGRPTLETIPGSETVLDADLIAVAIGQEMLEELLAGVPGLHLERGCVIVDPKTGQTTNPRYFAGGDCANGGKEVVNAAAEGKRAARGIDQWVSTSSLAKPLVAVAD